MKNTMINDMAAVIQGLVKENKAMREEISTMRVTIDNLEARNDAMGKALEEMVTKLMETEAKAEKKKEKPSKLWSITYTFHGMTKEFWLARDIYKALGGKGLKGYFEMVDGCERGDCVQIPRSTVKLCGCPEYIGDSMPYWMDEEAVDAATEWMADKERGRGRRKLVREDYDEEAVIKRYKETHSTYVVAEEFGVCRTTIRNVLKRNNVKVRNYNMVTKEMEAEIIRLYTEEKRSQREIGKIVGMSQFVVSHALRRNGIGKGLDR